MQLRLVLVLIVGVVGGLFLGELRSPTPAPQAFATSNIIPLEPGTLSAPIEEDDEPKRPDGLIDLNLATAAELELLPGIGASKSETVVANRNAKGPFASVDDLNRVPGFGEKTIERLRPYLTVSDVENSAQPVAFNDRGPEAFVHRIVTSVASAPSEPAPAPIVTPAGPVRINVAGVEELQRLEGIGPVMAERILKYRLTYGPYRTLKDLEKVKGVGPKTVEKNRNLISFE